FDWQVVCHWLRQCDPRLTRIEKHWLSQWHTSNEDCRCTSRRFRCSLDSKAAKRRQQIPLTRKLE
ncbi:MAG: hypothetical protein KDA84_08160, partial [Planctomycetaceae bacterium]|nr:hypothetical protein [Planctomycetaceae bacterium]